MVALPVPLPGFLFGLWAVALRTTGNPEDAADGLDDPLEVTRYHSLVVEAESLPECLEVTAWVDDDDITPGLIMGLRHRTLAIEGVQFHPESILTRQGHELLANFLERRA